MLNSTMRCQNTQELERLHTFDLIENRILVSDSRNSSGMFQNQEIGSEDKRSCSLDLVGAYSNADYSFLESVSISSQKCI